jgi:hypothetical protein
VFGVSLYENPELLRHVRLNPLTVAPLKEGLHLTAVVKRLEEEVGRNAAHSQQPQAQVCSFLHSIICMDVSFPLFFLTHMLNILTDMFKYG